MHGLAYLFVATALLLTSSPHSSGQLVLRTTTLSTTQYMFNRCRMSRDVQFCSVLSACTLIVRAYPAALAVLYIVMHCAASVGLPGMPAL